MTTDLQALGDDLFAALVRRTGDARRRDRRLRITALVAGAVCVFSATAVASGIADDLHLDPTRWSIVGQGSVDDGNGRYVHGERLSDGSHSTFMVEHDTGLGPYEAFLLHERTVAAARATSPVPVPAEAGALCSRADLTRAESVALATLRSSFPAGTDADATRAAVDSAVRVAFAGASCRGLEYAGEQARLVFAGVQPAATLMPGAG